MIWCYDMQHDLIFVAFPPFNHIDKTKRHKKSDKKVLWELTDSGPCIWLLNNVEISIQPTRIAIVGLVSHYSI